MVVRLAEMSERNLRVPPLLDALVASGRWPATPQASLRQNVEPLVSPERITALAPGEEWLYLYPPPFKSVASHVADHEINGWSFWVESGALHELDPDRALIIGDFGLGSDTPILLDYRQGDDPGVLRLAWPPSVEGDSPPGSITWVVLADSFEDFATRLGLV